MKIILHLRGCDIFVTCLLNNMHTLKSSDVDVVKIIGKESFTTDSSRILHANVGVHETKSVAISHGVQRVHRHHKTVLRCLECNHCVTNQRTFWYISVKNTSTNLLWISHVEKNVAKH